MFILALALLGSALAQDSTFTNTGTVYWKDCGVGNKWVSVRGFNIKPSPLVVPGDMTVTLNGAITHHLANSVSLDVTMEKKLLGRYTRIACNSGGVGTCHYDDPCHFLNVFKGSGKACPAQLVANHLPCTCPFDPKVLHLPESKFSVTGINTAWSWLATGDFHVKIEMKEKANNQLRGCVEAYMKMSVTPSGK